MSMQRVLLIGQAVIGTVLISKAIYDIFTSAAEKKSEIPVEEASMAEEISLIEVIGNKGENEPGILDEAEAAGGIQYFDDGDDEFDDDDNETLIPDDVSLVDVQPGEYGDVLDEFSSDEDEDDGPEIFMEQNDFYGQRHFEHIDYSHCLPIIVEADEDEEV